MAAMPVAAETRARAGRRADPTARPDLGRSSALAWPSLALGYALVDIATQKAGRDVVRIAGIAEAQEIFGGVPQEGDRLGSSDAPVSIQVFNDLQCSSCREDFLSTIPGLVEKYARPGDVKAALPPLLGQRKPAGAWLLRRRGGGRSRVTAGSTPTSSSATRSEAKRFGIDQRLPRLGGGGDRGTERARMAGIPRRRRRLRRRDQPAARRLRRTRHRASASAPARRRSSAAPAAPAPSRTVPAWPRSKPRSKRSSSYAAGLG